MAKQAKKPYAITVILSGRTNNFDKSNPDGTFTFKPIGNKRTTETSAAFDKPAADIAASIRSHSSHFKFTTKCLYLPCVFLFVVARLKKS